jgi:hypothetical protein
MQTEDIKDPKRELLELATAIETYRKDSAITKALLLRTHNGLGTDRTYNKIIGGDLAELDVEKWLESYKHVFASITDDDGSSSTTDEELIEDLSGPVELCRAYLETRKTKGDARFLLVVGESGTGKTSAVRIMKAKPYGDQVVAVEASDAWRGSKGTVAPFLRAIAGGLGMKDVPVGKDMLFDAVIAKLQGRRRCLIVEEAHHLDPQGINTIKSLINRTPVLVIATTMPVLWAKLSGSREAYAECKQLTGNRLAERVTLTLRTDDVVKLLTRRLAKISTTPPDLAKIVALELRAEAVQFGNMAFVSAVAKRFAREVKSGEPANHETFRHCIKMERQRR